MQCKSDLALANKESVVLGGNLLFSQARKSTSDNDTITPDLESWTQYALDEGNIDLAGKIDRLRIISSRKNLSVPMLCDIIILALMEGSINVEHILDDFR